MLATTKKGIVVVEVEVLAPRGFGRVRMRRIPDCSAASLIPFLTDSVEPGSAILTDGWQGYAAVSNHGYVHNTMVLSSSEGPAHVSMPAVYRVASLLKRWLLGTHQGSVRPKHLDGYLDEFTFRFNHRTSRRRGLLFYRLLEQAVVTDPAPYNDIVGGNP